MDGYAAVVGAVNIDIWGQTAAGVIPMDSNPGIIRFSLGGVGRNIARNLALLDTKVSMLTSFGDDLWADTLKSDLLQGGIDISQAIDVPKAATSAYLYITDPAGEMQLAVCDAEIVSCISPEYLSVRMDFLNRASLVVMDGNLSEEAIAFLTEHCTSPLFVDTVSVSKSRKFRNVLQKIHTIKPNAAEAKELTGENDPGKAALALTRAGICHAFVTDGENGVYAAEGSSCIHVPCCTARLVNCNGGGDAVLAALCRSFLDGRSILDSTRFSMAAGAIAVEGAETVSNQMSLHSILARMEKEYE